MLKYNANAFRLIRSKIGQKIGVLVVIQIIFIITSFSILSYYESLGTYLGNSINIAGKNRFLTSNLILHISEYFLAGSSDVSKITHVSKINSAMDQLESNILALRQGGKVSDIDLKPLPSEFFDDWNIIYQKWVSLKTILANNIIKPNEKINTCSNNNNSCNRQSYENNIRNKCIIFSRFIKCIGYKISRVCRKYFTEFNGSAKDLCGFKYCSCLLLCFTLL